MKNSPKKFNYSTNGEGFYSITNDLKSFLQEQYRFNQSTSGLLHLFITHTSCALSITESYDPSAKADIEAFLKHIAPRNLKFITHTLEGPDDSPSHMKSVLLNPFLSIFIENGKMVLGTWQGVYLCEFRDMPQTRSILVKFISD